jgi:DNA-binding GntR family transcriptional regulator
MTQQGRRGPKWKRITDDLRAEIEKGTYPPGTQLPTKAELMARYSVAVNTVARAIDELRRAGLVVTAQGSGMYVADVLPDPDAADPVLRELAALKAMVTAMNSRLDVIERQLAADGGQR